MGGRAPMLVAAGLIAPPGGQGVDIYRVLEKIKGRGVVLLRGIARVRTGPGHTQRDFPHVAVEVHDPRALAVMADLGRVVGRAGLAAVEVAIRHVEDGVVVGIAQGVIVVPLWEIGHTVGVVPGAPSRASRRLAMGQRQEGQGRPLKTRHAMPHRASCLGGVDGAVIGVGWRAGQAAKGVVRTGAGQRIAVFQRTGLAAVVRALIFVGHEAVFDRASVFERPVQGKTRRIGRRLVGVIVGRGNVDGVGAIDGIARTGRAANTVIKLGNPAGNRAVAVLVVAVGVTGRQGRPRQGSKAAR